MHLCGTKHRAISYRVMTDESVDYEKRRFDNTWRESASEQRRVEEGLSPVASQPRTTSGVLNRMHVDSTKSYYNVPNQYLQKTKVNQKWKENEKQTLLTHASSSQTHHRHFQHHEGKSPHLTRSNHRKDNNATSTSPPKHEAMLIPVAQSTPKAGRVTQRRMDNRLNGADLYVVRQSYKPQTTKKNVVLDPEDIDEISSMCTDVSILHVADDLPPRPMSLHDELKCKVSRPSKVASRDIPDCEPPLPATCSRPCYRCISYMEWAGIRRVFWSNHDGEWEGGKVRDLVDALGLDQGNAGGSDQTSASMFVTKHEILMLKKQMGVP